ncbi:MAG: protein-L-isoaspartate(D-aspartate) O-methyltransferase [Thermogutta sp.]|nr:protein-L-isoaspartate(D-aspartate) O-methyltransferase [Thermogutta sp.]
MPPSKRAGPCAGKIVLVFLLTETFALSVSQRLVSAQDIFAALREEMVRRDLIDGGIRDPRVLEAMRTVPRHEFVPPAQRRLAYYDMALPIGFGQTISGTLVVAYMTEQLDPQPDDKVLEIGTGSGYQAAVLSGLVREVYTIEIVEPLAAKAAQTLRRLGYKNVFVKAGDGYLGWPEHAPFDKIIVTCSPEDIPQPLVDQLKEGGRMVIPLGERYRQTLYLLRKTNGRMVQEALRPTLFVPMTGEAEARRTIRPDPSNPTLINGDFEEGANERREPDGWYYFRQFELRSDNSAPSGKNYAHFSNAVPGRAARALQGFPLDGRFVRRISLSFWVKGEGIRPGATPQDSAAVMITFYDSNRATVGEWSSGPLLGTFPWQKRTAVVPVPPAAREAILGIGMLGAVGSVSFDAFELAPMTRSGR